MYFLKNNYILIELSNKNEIRADVGITIQSLNFNINTDYLKRGSAK